MASTPPQHVTDFLSSTLGAIPPLALSPVLEGSNQTTHLLVQDATGERFGLKAVSGNRSRVTNELFTAAHILLVSELSTLLDAPAPIGCVRLPMTDGLGPLEGKEVVARKWVGATLDMVKGEAFDRIVAAPEIFLRPYGEWLAFGLLLGLCDGKARNWWWCANTERLGRFDVECSFYERVEPMDLSPGLTPFGFRGSLSRGAEPESAHFRSGMVTMVERFHSRRSEVLETVDPHGFARDFCDTWSWQTKGADEFSDLVLAGLRP